MSKLLLPVQETNKKTHIIIPVSNIENLDQKGLIDKTPFYFQPANIDIDPEILLLNPELQTYKLCVKQNFYKKCAGKSYNIFNLIDGYFTDIIVISSTKDISFNYSMTSKIPYHKYKLVIQALFNWFSPQNWWWLVYPTEHTGIICLTDEERNAFSKYPKLVKTGLQEQIINKLCKRIENLIIYLNSNANINKKPNAIFWIKFCNPLVSIRPGSNQIKPINNNNQLSGKDILNYLLNHTGFKQLCLQEYQGPANFLLFNLEPANFELCLSVFIRENTIIAISQSDLQIGYSAKLQNLINSNAPQIINLINTKWQKLISNRDYQNNLLLEYEDVVLTIELVTKMTSEGTEVFSDICIWNIEMGYGAWTQTGSKLFTWAELDMLSGTPPVIKLIAKSTN